MSIVSNHHPEVIDAMNAAAQEGERPAPWDSTPTDAQLDHMASQVASRFGPDVDEADDDELLILTGRPALYRPAAQRPETVAVSREALDAYQAAQDRLHGFLEALASDLSICHGPNVAESLARRLRGKLVEMDTVARTWTASKYAV